MNVLLIIWLILIIIIVVYYLAYLNNFSDIEGFVTGQTGIDQICNPSLDPASYNNPDVCFDISYNDTTTGTPVQVKARIQSGYYIGPTGYLKIVPYGNIASVDKHSYNPKTQTASYNKAVEENKNAEISSQIAQIEQKIAAGPSEFVLNGLQQQLNKLKQQQNSQTTASDSTYNSDNFDLTYHSDPNTGGESDQSTAGVGRMWVSISGELVSIPYSDVSNTTLYYSPGTYTYNSASYVPNYEETVFLSKLTNEPTTINVQNMPKNQSGFCAATQSSIIERDAKCNSVDKNVCASTECCVLLGGSKCVAGDQNGPSNKTNYSDTTIVNRDYYYYRGTCFGNCP